MSEKFGEWAILELMGHRRLGGYVTEQEIAGTAFLRIDVPGDDDSAAATQFYAPAAVYAITPTTEEIARAVAAHNRPEPVHRWELPAPTKVEILPTFFQDPGVPAAATDEREDADDPW